MPPQQPQPRPLRHAERVLVPLLEMTPEEVPMFDDPVVRNFIHFCIYAAYGAFVVAVVSVPFFVMEFRKAKRRQEEFRREFDAKYRRVDGWIDEEHERRRRTGSGKIV